MSEYQYLAFRAVDRPLTDRELAFAAEQSTRAAISQWSFENEYHFGNFRGDVEGLLRHGYDVHLHYANYGIRSIALRLPAGPPLATTVWSKYTGTGQLEWSKDRKGTGGILSVSLCHDGGELYEFGDPSEYIEHVIEIRNRLIAGDLRALYVLWLCAAYDDQLDWSELVEPPVPGGLAECEASYEALLDFFGLDPLILVAAAEGAPTAPEKQDQSRQVGYWVAGLTNVEAKHLLTRFLSEDAVATKAETVATIRRAGSSTEWPSATLQRTFEDLLNKTEAVRAEHDAKQQKKRDAAARREAAEQERQRQQRLMEMAKDPQKWLREAERLADARGAKNYQAAADLLATLREAVGGDKGEKLTRTHAAHLTKKYPTRTRLKSSLRKSGLL